MAVAQGKKPPLQWQQCLDGLLETLKTANNSPGLHEEERPLMKPCRDQILVALTTLLKWLEDCPVDCTTTIPVVDLAHILVGIYRVEPVYLLVLENWGRGSTKFIIYFFIANSHGHIGEQVIKR